MGFSSLALSEVSERFSKRAGIKISSPAEGVHKGRFVTQPDRLRVIGDGAVVVFFGFVG